MYEAELTQARARARDLLIAWRAAGKAYESAPEAQKRAAEQALTDASAKLTESNADVTRLAKAQTDHATAEQIGRDMLEPDPTKRVQAKRPEQLERRPGMQAHRKALLTYMREGKSAYRQAFLDAGGHPSQLAEFTGAGEGVLLTETFADIDIGRTAGTVMVGLVNVQPTVGVLNWPKMSDDNTDWDGMWSKRNYRILADGTEATNTTSTIDIAPKDFNPPYQFIDQGLLNNRGANVETIVATLLRRKADQALEHAITRGNGAGKPIGFMHELAGVKTISSRAATTLTIPGIFNLVMSVPEQWSDSIAIVMRRITMANLLAAEDPAGTYALIASMRIGADAVPGTFLGLPMAHNQFMDTVGAGKKPVAAGNWRGAYVLAREQAAERLLRDESAVFSPGVGLALTDRLGGAVVQPDALRIMVIQESAGTGDTGD